MANQAFKSDIQAVWQNVIYTEDKRVLYLVENKGFQSSFDSDQELHQQFDRLKDVFKGAYKELHLLVVPVRQNLDEIHGKYTDGFAGNLKHVAVDHTDAIFNHLKHSDELGGEENKLKFYMAIELNRASLEIEEESLGFKEILATVKKYIYDVALKSTGVKTSFFNEQLHRQTEHNAKSVQRSLDEHDITFSPLEAEDMARVISWIFNFGITHQHNYENWYDRLEPIYGRKGEVVALVKTQEDVLRLQMTGIDNAKSRKHLVLHQTDARGHDHTTYVSFLQIAEMPSEMWFPETRWLELLEHFSFPVGVSLKLRYVSADKRLNRLRLKKTNLEDQHNHLGSFGERSSSNVVQGIRDAEEVIGEVEKSREGGFVLSGSFVVSASNFSELQTNRTNVINEYEKIGFKLQATYGLQLRSLLDCLPGSRRYVTEFLQDIDLNALTASFFGNRRELGDDYGYYEGRTNGGMPVFRRPGRAASSETKMASLVSVNTGKTGSGKSVAVNNNVYETVLAGGRVLLLDPKAERKELLQWDKRLTELGVELNFVSVTTKDKDKGKLDPFLMFDDRDDSESMAREIINYILNISIREDTNRSFLIQRACKNVSEYKKPAMRFVKDELRHMAEGKDKKLSEERRVIALDLAESLEQFEEVTLAKLFFGEPIDGEANYLDMHKQLNILELAELTLPPKNQEPSTEKEILSVAIMFGLIGYMIKFMRMYPEQLSSIVLEEVWNFFVNAAGERLIDKLFREGRTFLTPIILATQNLKDVPSSIRGQIGSSYHFYTDDSEDIEVVREHLGLSTDVNLASIMPSLDKGWCLHRDLDNRIGVMEIRVLQRHLFKAFDTSVKPGETRDFDKQQEIEQEQLELQGART